MYHCFQKHGSKWKRSRGSVNHVYIYKNQKDNNEKNTHMMVKLIHVSFRSESKMRGNTSIIKNKHTDRCTFFFENVIKTKKRIGSR